MEFSLYAAIRFPLRLLAFSLPLSLSLAFSLERFLLLLPVLEPTTFPITMLHGVHFPMAFPVAN